MILTIWCPNLSAKKEGIKDSDIKAIEEKISFAHGYVQANRGKGMMGWTELPINQDNIVDDIIATATDVRKRFKYL